MIYDIKLDSSGNRSHVIDHIKGLRVIDVGGSTSFADGHLEAIADFSQPRAKCDAFFQGNINMHTIWEQILEYVAEHGKFDFAICTHTLEDISNPVMACTMLPLVAKAGYISMPSKYFELSYLGDPFRGFIHHRWIFDIIDGEFTGFPKINYIESPVFDAISKHPEAENRKELSFWWKDDIGFKIVNNDWLGPDTKSIQGYYDALLKDI